jgi:hypothetical protein
MKPKHALRAERDIRRDRKTLNRRLRDRMFAAHIAIAFLQHAAGQEPKLPRGVARLSLNELAADAAEKLGQADAGNVESRVWRPSLPVIHLAAAVAVAINDGERNGHTPRQIKQIARSISVFGFLIPVIIDEASRVLVGAGRLMAAMELGSTEVPTVQVTHLSEAQKKAFTIADSRLSEIAKWDDRVLAEQLKELSIVNLDFDIEVTGFDMGEIDLRIESLNLDIDETDPADVLPEKATGKPVAQTGDLWTLGRHRLLCGDALDPTAYVKLMRGK